MSERLKKIVIFSLKYRSMQFLFALVIDLIFKKTIFLNIQFFGLGLVSIIIIVVFTDKFK